MITSKFARFVLFRIIKKCSFNLLCVLDLFSERWQSTLFQMFFCCCFLIYITQCLPVSVSGVHSEARGGRSLQFVFSQLPQLQQGCPCFNQSVGQFLHYLLSCFEHTWNFTAFTHNYSTCLLGAEGLSLDKVYL